MATYINFQTLYKCFTNIACIIYQRTILYKVLPSVQRHGYHTNIRAFQIFRFSNIFLFSVQIFEKVNNFKSQRGCRAVVGKGSFPSISPTAPQKVARMHQFSVKISTNGWGPDGGDKLVENFSKRSETDFKLCIWLGCGLLWPQLVKDMGKFSPIHGNHLLSQYITVRV